MVNQYIGGNSCNLFTFIQNIYDSDIIFPEKERRTNECFLRGTFVFEDNESKMFKMLYNCQHTQSFWKTTHSEVKNKIAVDASLRLKGTVKLQSVDEKWDEQKNKKGYIEKLYQYEVIIDPPFEYSCNKECRLVSPSTDCPESLKDPKGVALLYHFRIKAIDGKQHAYTFLKLEGHYSLSIGHTVSAFDRYILKKNAKPANLPSRREDCGEKCEFKGKRICNNENKDNCSEYNERNDYHIIQFKKAAPDMALSIDKSIDIYSKNIRTGDELFVPQDITNALLISTDPKLMD